MTNLGTIFFFFLTLGFLIKIKYIIALTSTIQIMLFSLKQLHLM